MNCDAKSLLIAAKCYQCVPKAVWGPTVISLLCQWAKNSGTVECGTPSNYIILTGGSAAGFYIRTSPTKWERTGVFPPTIEFNGTGWDIILFGNVLYTSDVFPCTWIQVTGGLPVPTGVYYSITAPTVTWSPNTEVAQWADITGNHSGDLATFQSTADAPTVLNLIFGATGNLTAINNLDNLTALTNLEVNTNSLTSIDLTNCTTLQTLLCYNNTGLTALTGIGTCTSLVTLDCNTCDITGTLDVSGLANLTTLSCFANANMTGVNVTGCPSIQLVDCAFSGMLSLDVSPCIALTTLNCDNNPLMASINITGCVNLVDMVSNVGSVTSLDASTCSSAANIQMGDNQLTSFSIGNSTHYNVVDAINNHLLVASVDDILSKLATNCLGNAPAVCDLSSGTNASPTGGVLNPDYVALIGAGWIVSIN